MNSPSSRACLASISKDLNNGSEKFIRKNENEAQEMYPKYNPKDIESKWRRKWQITDLYRASDSEDKPKYYCLDFFHIDQEWPSCDPELAKDKFTQIPIQVNGKVCDLVEVPFFAGRSEVEAAAFNLPKIKQVRKKG